MIDPFKFHTNNIIIVYFFPFLLILLTLAEKSITCYFVCL